MIGGTEYIRNGFDSSLDEIFILLKDPVKIM